MRDPQPILVLDAARPADIPGAPREPALTLTVAPGDLLLIEARDDRRAVLFADLCSGLVPLGSGSARFLGQDWAKLPAEMAAALRGRMGRVFADGGWIGFLDMEANILLAALHHTRRGRDALRSDAAAARAGGDMAGAADLYLRAGRSATAQGDVAQARLWLAQARALATDPQLRRAVEDELNAENPRSTW